MIPTVLQVALGGAIGAAARYGVGVAFFRPGGGFPIGVLAVNVIGSFLMGLVVVYLGQKMLSHFNPFLMTGILGGFTTFSAFSLEAYTLFERGEVGQAALYVGLSVVLSIAALIAGIFIMRGLLA
ncbi:fluoride efflux transporter CrcB [Octadecabacter sp. G9-8]|uniref:Fluoride-specific ion channel FluC n=1 Tax=Octadecabacter dasysiphoniae TaxID=2909341 RepID=A0ABS9D2S0_9RHOB|nr:fluoride efflux transporter CrcB [Octadecabacter dasysiphoniae]MCF2872924.1 fluoride efflux transporter CrcB [Octadecabacter dasysiphoniae]